MRIYVYSKCSTCRDALKYLKDCGIHAEIKEITETPPSMEELKQMLIFYSGNLKKLFNTSGNLYKEMQLAQKLTDMPEKDALELLSKHGMLVKRPFLIDKRFGLVGFKPDWLSNAVKLK